jgi:hypothetical protein
MQRYGATTVARWLTEELPEGVRAYIEDDGTLFELVGLEATSGRLLPRTKLKGYGSLCITRACRLALGTPVILSMAKDLAGLKLATLTSQIVRASLGSFALPRNGECADTTASIT